jgi:hypothetical protein
MQFTNSQDGIFVSQNQGMDTNFSSQFDIRFFEVRLKKTVYSTPIIRS